LYFQEVRMFILVRAAAYATLFVGFVLVALPARVLSASGVVAPPATGVWQAAGLVVGTCGAAVALACIITFVFEGRGTPAPFDPPRRLVAKGPYAVLRNPMYLGAAVAIGGATLFYQSLALLGYVAAFLIVTHLFVVAYEEPALRRTFGRDYEIYCQRVRRWWVA
jgi:protein-S-isoprenylcysteine O-methyltransferase Ste14